jgi:hypothetical protein
LTLGAGATVSGAIGSGDLAASTTAGCGRAAAA